jgi:hypothetical protein
VSASSAVSAVCDRCRCPLTADHVLREGATHCYRCELWLLRAYDLAAAPARPRRWGRRARRGGFPVALNRSVFPDSAAAARRQRPAGRRRPVAA